MPELWETSKGGNQMIATEKGPSVLAHQTSQGKINSRIIIPRQDDFRPVCLFGFIGSVGVFRQFIKGQRILLDAGIVLP